ncbi:Phosphotransferase [Mucor velutinosus]|uniref:Phosphotransferase n=1 Tax=Mucor velutinosus TaxID=708070 RepID=A0AAN7DD25_9FUNG|nr:Phosphotransferase [Mucor velutinosus]
MTMSAPTSTIIYRNRISLKGKKPYKSWIKDGVNGGPSSMDVLIKWLSYRPNYKKWRREDYSMDRVPKKDLLEEIIDKLRQVGIYHRLAKDVASKISTLQSNYRLTRKWSETEGYKIKYQMGGEKALHDELVKRFPYWDHLHPVFGFSNSAMDLDNLVLKSPSPSSRCRQNSNESIHSATTNTTNDDDLERFLHFDRRKEMERMQKSRDMLYVLRQKKQEKQRREEQLSFQHEKLQVEKDFMNCLYKAGFTPTEALCYIK